MPPWRRALAILCLALLSCLASEPALAQVAPAFPCTDTDAPCADKAMSGHAASSLATWRGAMSVPAAQRVGPAPPLLVEYIRLDNIKNAYPQRPRAATPDAALLADVDAAIAELPGAVWGLFGERLAGLYFVEDLGGTGYTDYVFDSHGRAVAAYVVLDIGVLARMRANAWASWKENTPFKAGPAYRLEARIEDDANDNRKNAIQYILLHELGHVLSVGARLHPPWNLDARAVDPGEHYAFFKLSWTIDRRNNRYRSLFDAAFPERAATTYYFGARLSAHAMLPTYRKLAKTNFPSLYAATHPGDDFAESFASYVHVVLMQRPWQIRISNNGRPVLTMPSCWSESRCAGKRALLERLVGPGR